MRYILCIFIYACSLPSLTFLWKRNKTKNSFQSVIITAGPARHEYNILTCRIMNKGHFVFKNRYLNKDSFLILLAYFLSQYFKITVQKWRLFCQTTIRTPI